MMQFDCLVEGTVITDAESDATASGGRPFVTFRIDHQQGYYDATGTWQNTLRVPYEITCWDQNLMPTLAGVRKGQRVLVHANRFKIREDRHTGETLFDLTPDLVETVTDSPNPHAFQCLLTGLVTASAQSGTIGPDRRPMVSFRMDHQQGYHDRRGTWRDTVRTPYQVTCWDKNLMPVLDGIRRGQRVFVKASRFNILPDARTGNDLFNLTPDFVRVLAAPAQTQQRQRDGHTVVTPHGEQIDARAWPDVVTDLELVHHP
jgi:single-stranded DNA-binding protein